MVRVRLLCGGLAVALFGLPLTVVYPQSPAAKQELKALVDRWVNADDPNNPESDALSLVILPNGTFKFESKTATGWRQTSGTFKDENITLTVDPTKKPKRMDIGDANCIYDLRGNELKVGWPTLGDRGTYPASWTEKGLDVKIYKKAR